MAAVSRPVLGAARQLRRGAGRRAAAHRRQLAPASAAGGCLQRWQDRGLVDRHQRALPRLRCLSAGRASGRSDRSTTRRCRPLSRTTTGAGTPSGWSSCGVRVSVLEQVADDRNIAEPGTFSTGCHVLSCTRPPSTTMEPSSTSTLVSIARLLVIDAGGVGGAVPRRRKSPGRSPACTVPPSLICGRTRSVRPTSLRSMVWNGLTRPPPMAGVGELAGDEGHVLADHDLGFLVVQRQQVRRGQDVAVGVGSRNARQELQVVTCRRPAVIRPICNPELRRPTSAGPARPPMMLVPAVPKLVPPTLRLLPPALPSPVCHWMPNSAAWSPVTSTIRLSMKTCARPHRAGR